MAEFASALSQHPDARIAVGEVVGHIADQLDGSPEVVAMFVSGSYLADFAQISASVRQLLGPRCFIGCSAAGTLGGSQEIGRGRGLVVWAALLDEAQTFRVEPGEHGLDEFELMLSGMPGGGSAILLVDGSTVAIESLLKKIDLANHNKDSATAVVGGFASMGSEPGQNVLVIDDHTVHDGGVGVIFDPGVAHPIVSQGYEPIGSPWTVTKSDGQLIQELAGESAVARLNSILANQSDDESQLAPHQLHLGVVVDETSEAFSQGDFLLQPVLGIGWEPGSIAVEENIAVGQVVQFHIRNEMTAADELQRLLGGVDGRSALVFASSDRSSQMFSEPSQDATAAYEHVGPAVGGMLGPGEFGPVGSRHVLQDLSVNMVVFR